MSSGGLDRLAEAVADGDDVDWLRAHRRIGKKQRALARQLETLSSFTARTRDTWSAGFRAEPRLPYTPLLRVVGALAAGQVVIAVAGISANAAAGDAGVTMPRLLAFCSFAGTAALLAIRGLAQRTHVLALMFLIAARAFVHGGLRAGVDAFIWWLPGHDVLASSLHPEAFLPFLAWQFARVFPSVKHFSVLDVIARRAVTACAVIGSILFVASIVADRSPSQHWAVWLDRGAGDALPFWLINAVATLGALAFVVLRARLASAAEQQRVRVFSFALALGMGPMLVEVVLEATIAPFRRMAITPGPQGVLAALVFIPVLAVAPFTAYAVLVRQVVPTRALIAESLTYLASRFTLSSLTLAPFALVLWRLNSRRAETVADILAAPDTRAFVAAFAVGCVLLLSRGWILRRIDNWCGVHRVEPSAALEELTQALRAARTPGELSRVVGDLCGRALQASCAVWARTEHCFAAVHHSVMPLPVDAALVSVLSASDEPVVVGMETAASVSAWLPHREQAWVTAGRLCALTGIRHGHELAAIVGIGFRRDGLGQSTSDLRFLAAAGSAASLAWARVSERGERTRPAGDASVEFAAQCPACGVVLDAPSARHCECGGRFENAALPRLLFGKFELRALLGRGGMGVAYRAEDLMLGRTVAVKTLPKLDVQGALRLQNEARLMASLSDANLATIFAVDWWRDTPLLIVEYLSGGTLAARLAAAGALPERDVVALTATLAGALSRIHLRGLLHLDVKPSNIAFAADGTVKLLDFGVSRLAGSAVDGLPIRGAGAAYASSHGGTLAFLPPEALRGDQPNVQRDLWALAVVLWECVSGVHPFADGVATADRILCGEPVTAPRVTNDALRSVLNRALHHDPTRRFLDAAAFRAALLGSSHSGHEGARP